MTAVRKPEKHETKLDRCFKPANKLLMLAVFTAFLYNEYLGGGRRGVGRRRKEIIRETVE
jgi:hypothetical protein